MLKFSYSSEKRVIERIRANERQVLGELYLRFEKMILSFVGKQGGSKDDAADLLQEVIIVFWKNALDENFQLHSKLSTYLMAIARNKWLAERRKSYHLTREQMPANREDDQPGALDQLIDVEKVKELKHAFSKISEVCRKLLSLFYFEERSMKEIAGLLNFANVDVAKAKKYQCKKSLQKFLIENMQMTERGIR